MADRGRCPSCGSPLTWTGSEQVHRCRCRCGYEEWHALKPLAVFADVDEGKRGMRETIARWFRTLRPETDRGRPRSPKNPADLAGRKPPGRRSGRGTTVG